MKTALFSVLAFSIFIIAGLNREAYAQKPKHKTEKIIIRSSDEGPMEINSLRDTIIISNDGKDTTFIKTTNDGKKKKVTVRKVITSGKTEESLHWVEAENETLDTEDGDHVVVRKSKEGEPHTIFIEKRITKDDDSDSIIVKEIRGKELADEKDFNFDEPGGAKQTSVSVITENGKEIENDGDGKTTIIYINDDNKDHRRKIKKHGKHQKTYIIEETKTIKKQE
jgi:hypothetical protein